MQKVRYHILFSLRIALTAYMIADSDSFSLVIDFLFIFPSRYSSLSLHHSYLAFEDGSPISFYYLKRTSYKFSLTLLIFIFNYIHTGLLPSTDYFFQNILYYNIDFLANSISLATTLEVTVVFLSYSY